MVSMLYHQSNGRDEGSRDSIKSTSKMLTRDMIRYTRDSGMLNLPAGLSSEPLTHLLADDIPGRNSRADGLHDREQELTLHGDVPRGRHDEFAALYLT